MKKLLIAPVFLAASLALSGCGFHPLYGDSGGAGSVEAALTGIDVAPQTTRAGQLVRNEILSGIAPASAGGGARVLDFTAEEKETPAVVSFNSGNAQNRYILNVAYVLKTRGGRVLTRGKTFSEVSYTVTRQPAADMQARIRASETAARVAAEDIRTRLAAWLAAHG